ncbi:hypothetical protein JYT20_00180 [Rhodothermus sp. AH-315-K08]|nr:hypothetical protein [Rhodothermus sp. AH-315-K08]
MAPNTKLQKKLDARDAFLHVVLRDRYFSVACFAWDSFGPGGDGGAQMRLNQAVPGVGVLIKDSLLLHARTLMEFYVSDSPRPPPISFSPTFLQTRQLLRQFFASTERQ